MIAKTDTMIPCWALAINLCLIIGNSAAVLGAPSREHGRKLLTGVHFRIPGFINPPLFTAETGPDGNVTYKGADKDLVDWLAASLNFTYVPLNQSQLQKQGPIQTMVDMLVNRRVDLIATAITRSWNRKDQVDFCYPHVINSFKIAAPWPKERNRNLTVLRPFTLTVWLLTLAFVFITAFFLTAIAVAETRLFASRNGDGKTFTAQFVRFVNYIVNNSLGQDDYFYLPNQSIRLVQSAWLLMAVVIVNAYCSQLASYLTLPVFEKAIDSFDDLVERSDIPLTVAADSVFLQTLMDARTGPYKILADRFRKHPENMVTTIPEMLGRMFSGKFAYANANAYIEIVINNDFKERKTCRAAVSKPLSFSSHLSYGMAVGGSIIDIVNNRMIFIWERGLVDGWLRPTRNQYERCVVKPPKPRMRSLKMIDFYSAFILLGIGTALSFLTFVIENIRFKLQRMPRKSN